MRKSILQIYLKTKETNSNDEQEQDQAIIQLADHLNTFILENAKQRQDDEVDPVYKNILGSFLKVCFNPSASIDDKILENRALSNLKYELKLKREKLTLQLEDQEKPEDRSLRNSVNNIEDNIDFIKALSNNCLNGPTNPLLSVLSSNEYISKKLKAVFSELLKNGIAMPKEMIFFNKSNGLLEGF